MELIQNGKATSGTAIFALEQTHGKGQRGKRWETNPGENIVLTVIINAEQYSPLDQFPVSAAVILGCHDFFSTYSGCDTWIKWPNDLYWRDRKAGGILIENKISAGKWKWAVIGIGINVHQVVFNQFQQRAVSLKQITGKNFDLIELAKELCVCLEKRVKDFEKYAKSHTLDEFNERLYKKGQVATFKKNQVVFNATVVKTNLQGGLEIEHGVWETIKHGETEWLL